MSEKIIIDNKYDVIIKKACLTGFKPKINEIKSDIENIIRNQSIIEGKDIYSIERKFEVFDTELNYLIERRENNLIIYDVHIIEGSLDKNSSNGVIIKNDFGYIVRYAYYEIQEDRAICKTKKEALNIIFNLRKYNWNSYYFDEIYYSKISEEKRYIQKLLDKYAVIKMDKQLNIYGIYDNLEETKEKRDCLIKSNWQIKEKEYPKINTSMINSKPPFLHERICLKTKDSCRDLYILEHCENFVEILEKLNKHFPPRGIYHYKHEKYEIRQREGIKETYVININYSRSKLGI